MPEKQDYEEELENVLLDSEEGILNVDSRLELGSEERAREVDNQVKIYSAISDRNFKIGSLENEKLKNEKDSEIRILEIKCEKQKELIKDGIYATMTGLTVWGSIKSAKALLKYEERGTLMSDVSKNFFKNVLTNIGKAFHF